MHLKKYAHPTHNLLNKQIHIFFKKVIIKIPSYRINFLHFYFW